MGFDQWVQSSWSSAAAAVVSKNKAQIASLMDTELTGLILAGSDVSLISFTMFIMSSKEYLINWP